MAIESEKLLRALRAKAPFDDEQLALMSDTEGWDWLYRFGSPLKDERDQVCFTGFGATDCEELVALANRTGWLKPVTVVTKKLTYLCFGPNAGPAKLAKAGEQGATLLDKEQFLNLIALGEIPRKLAE